MILRITWLEIALNLRRTRERAKGEEVNRQAAEVAAAIKGEVRLTGGGTTTHLDMGSRGFVIVVC